MQQGSSLVEVEVRVYCSRELSVCSLMSASLICQYSCHAFKLKTRTASKQEDIKWHYHTLVIDPLAKLAILKSVSSKAFVLLVDGCLFGLSTLRSNNA